MSPDKFIPLAEHTGLIRPLTLQVIATALDQCAAWRANGLELGVAVNLSPRNVMDPDLPRQIKQLLEERGLPAKLLELEVTEDTIMSDP
jgi:EAL domain-containing protein (putative c-di-GMP-specific phosphodiesterase class I)